MTQLTHRQKRRLKKLLLLAAALGAIALVVGQIKVDPPTELRGALHVSGRINQCEFKNMRRRSSVFFVGIELDTPGAPCLRANPRHGDRAFYESLCRRKANVNIRYRAVQRVMGPLRFWVDEIVPIR